MRFNLKKYGIILLVFCFMLSSGIIFAQGVASPNREIYSKLADLNCKAMPLDKCFCPAAKEMKAYIDALIETGTAREEIFYKVAKRFSLNAILDNEIKTNVGKRLSLEFGSKRPQISLEFTSFDFGKVSRKQGVMRKNIKFYNKGEEPLIIKKIKATCSCTTVALTVGKEKSPYFGSKGSEPGWQMAVGPGQSGELEFVLDLSSLKDITIPMKVQRHIYITSNDPIFSEIDVYATANVIE